ncbi:MAG: sodium:solute symporter [Fulvivirga sp.]|uniref:sodium:solute symporter n=1 Tax=Fulvivirga sp. TaxID=1931237 RepID=UPI0032ECD084
MSPQLVLSVVFGYFLILILISFLTSKKADSSTFFTANRQSPWYLVAFGMIGASLSGVTFISVPGWVGTTQFSYMQMVFGYLAGYAVIGLILMPLYYRLNLISIYQYLEQRFGFWSYKTGAAYFLLSRVIGASFRLFLVAGVLQLTLFDAWNVSFEITVAITIMLIWLYTFRGGINTIVWTDSLQTLFMLSAVGAVIISISNDLNFTFGEMVTAVQESQYSKTFFWDWQLGSHFVKQFLSGAFIAIVMTGLDQDMMQKNLTCKNIGEAQKNMFWFSVILVFANLLFLCLGALLYIYSNANGIEIPAKTDDLFPMLATQHFSTFIGIVFLLGIIAAAYSSADSALTSLTTSFCIDFLNFSDEQSLSVQDTQKRTRLFVHLGFSVLLFVVILIFKNLNNEAVISSVFKAAGYTYGPLLGIYAFGLFTKLQVRDYLVPVICVASPILSYLLNIYSAQLLWGYQFGFEILLINGLLTFVGLLLITKKVAHV